MQVIGAGPGRTGTMSAMSALELLGFGPCHHMSVVMREPEQQDGWAEVLGGGEPDWSSLLKGYQSCVDWPTAAYWRELTTAYPSAKVLLTTRDADAWYRSMSRTILPLAYGDPNTLRARLTSFGLRLARPRLARLVAVLPTMTRAFFGTDHMPSRDEAVAAFERRHHEVRAAVPADRLLVFDVTEGWAPLCEFLEVPVPDEPFPRTNDTASFRDVLPPLARR